MDDATFGAMCRDSFPAYASAINPKWDMPPHVDIMCQVLEAVERGDKKLVMVCMPPRHSKSWTTTNLFPSWYLGKHPDHMVMIGCHTQSLADDFGSRIRDNVASPLHQMIFPECRLANDSAAKRAFKTTQNGEFFAVGVGGPITGRGAHLMIIDDPIKGFEDANSPVQRENLHNWFTSVALTRLEPDAALIIVNTRWHEDDLSGWLLDATKQEEVDDWELLSFPAIAEEDEGWRKPGEALWPSRYPIEKLSRIKKRMPERDFTSLYQQHPSILEGGLFRRAWLKEYSWDPSVVYMLDARRLGYLVGPFRIIQSWDCNLDEGQENDYAACTTWLNSASGDYLLDVWRGKPNGPALFEKAIELIRLWRPNGLLIERAANGFGLIRQLEIFFAKPENGINIPIIPFQPIKGKVLRANAVSHMVQGGRVLVPATEYGWKKAWVQEICAFPQGAYDDQVDSTTQYLQWSSEQLRWQEQVQEDEQPQELSALYGS